ncbi:hypothetical protein [Paenibacillus thiaminolyticus]|nr:hypothetical protein [Paenibacillus thiaminolyticus]
MYSQFILLDVIMIIIISRSALLLIRVAMHAVQDLKQIKEVCVA